jgi:hypothetical protein
MGQTVVRRRSVPQQPTERVILRFTTGKVVCPADCPLGIQAHSHWHRLDGEVPDGEPNCECECVRASRADATSSVPMAEGGGRAHARSPELVTPGSPVGQETGEGNRLPSPVSELVGLGAVDVRVDGSSVLGTFRRSALEGGDAHVRVHELEPMPTPEPLPDGRVRYRFARLGTWAGYIDVEADR